MKVWPLIIKESMNKSKVQGKIENTLKLPRPFASWMTMKFSPGLESTLPSNLVANRLVEHRQLDLEYLAKRNQ